MALTEVKITQETYLTCMTHALSTETEEIMGLLLGDIECSKDGSAVALVWWAAPQTRSDRRKDRVETNPEQLAAASAQAEKMSAAIGRTTRVIGWYHSHPHITVMPSHVDVRTQAMYQMLDSGFVGLIFSCFSEDSNKVGRISVIAFQSLDGHRSDAVNLRVQPTNSAGIVSNRAAPVAPVPSGNDVDQPGTTASGKVDPGLAASKQQTAALESLFAIADSEARSTPGTSNAEDESLSMQEAMHLSTLEASGAEFVRKEIYLDVVPSRSLVQLKNPLAPFVELQKILFEEEQAAFRHAMAQSTVNGRIHPLAVLHHEAQYQAMLAKLMEYCLCPAISCLSDQIQSNKLRLLQMQNESQALQLERISISSKGSPKTPQSVRRIPQRALGPSSSTGRPQSDVLSPPERRSFDSTGTRSAPEARPVSDLGRPQSEVFSPPGRKSFDCTCTRAAPETKPKSDLGRPQSEVFSSPGRRSFDSIGTRAGPEAKPVADLGRPQSVVFSPPGRRSFDGNATRAAPETKPVSDLGRPQSEVFSPPGRRSFDSTGTRAAPETKPVSDLGRPQSEVFSPPGRRSFDSTGTRAAPESQAKPGSGAPDLMQF